MHFQIHCILLCFFERHRHQLVLAFLRLQPIFFLLLLIIKFLKLTTFLFDHNLIAVFDFKKTSEFIFEPFQLLLETHYSNILAQFGLLFRAFGFQKLQLLFNFDHVHLVGVDEVLLMLTENFDKFIGECIHESSNVFVSIQDGVHILLNVVKNTGILVIYTTAQVLLEIFKV